MPTLICKRAHRPGKTCTGIEHEQPFTGGSTFATSQPNPVSGVAKEYNLTVPEVPLKLSLVPRQTTLIGAIQSQLAVVNSAINQRISSLDVIPSRVAFPIINTCFSTLENLLGPIQSLLAW